LSKFKAHNFFESLKYALQGLAYAYRTQRNLRVHLLMAVLVLLVAVAFNLDRIEIALVVLCIGIVICCELINTAIESTIDLVTQEYHPLAKIAKNVAAAAVLVAGGAAASVGFFVFYERLINLHQEIFVRPIAAPSFLTFVGLVLVLIIVLVAKAMSQTVVKVPRSMPSGHTAVAFSLATAIFFTSTSKLSVLLALAIAGLVAQSRIEARSHSTLDVVVGAVVGILVTAIIFQLAG
jgi:diacylglycerol kinase (ATP)